MADEIGSVAFNAPQSERPKLTAAQAKKTPLELLADADVHARVLQYLTSRIKESSQRMSKFYDRWQVAERKAQAYIRHDDYEAMLKEMNKESFAPKAVDLVIPYNYAAIQTRGTYLLQTFAGRRPMFQVNATTAEATDSARSMELLLQYNADKTRMISRMWQFFLDCDLYGVAILRTSWKKEQKLRTVILPTQPGAPASRGRQTTTIFEGTEVSNVEPFNFFPDPLVPMHEVNRKGEFVFWRSVESYHAVKTAEFGSQGRIAYVDKAPKGLKTDLYSNNQSERNRSIGTSEHDSDYISGECRGREGVLDIIQGTVRIIPAVLGLGESKFPELWLFSVAGGKQIIQAEKFDADHDMHPVCVAEPTGFGYGFGSISMSDMLAPIQDQLSWLINSHMHNVRMVLNNQFIVDPSKIEMQDVKQGGPGKIIRLKNTAYGQDPNTAIRQLQVQDVTRSHISDFNTMMNISDSISAVTDNMRGLQEQGGRKTASEVRMAMEAGTSRLATTARIISAQAFVDLTEQCSLNYQQYLSEDFSIKVLGMEEASIHLTPQHIVGDFNYPVTDGTLPMDRLALIDLWKEMMMGVGQSPVLSQRLDLVEMFMYTAELAGAKNIKRFELQPQQQGMIDQQVQDGNLIPTKGLANKSMAGSLGASAIPMMQGA